MRDADLLDLCTAYAVAETDVTAAEQRIEALRMRAGKLYAQVLELPVRQRWQFAYRLARRAVRELGYEDADKHPHAAVLRKLPPHYFLRFASGDGAWHTLGSFALNAARFGDLGDRLRVRRSPVFPSDFSRVDGRFLPSHPRPRPAPLPQFAGSAP